MDLVQAVRNTLQAQNGPLQGGELLAPLVDCEARGRAFAQAQGRELEPAGPIKDSFCASCLERCTDASVVARWQAYLGAGVAGTLGVLLGIFLGPALLTVLVIGTTAGLLYLVLR